MCGPDLGDRGPAWGDLHCGELCWGDLQCGERGLCWGDRGTLGGEQCCGEGWWGGGKLCPRTRPGDRGACWWECWGRGGGE